MLIRNIKNERKRAKKSQRNAHIQTHACDTDSFFQFIGVVLERGKKIELHVQGRFTIAFK